MDTLLSLRSELELFPELLSRIVAAYRDERVRQRPAAGGFSLVEHVWHLADLEREGFATRVHRLLTETSPILGDFLGDRLARERRYQDAGAQLGAALFVSARAATLRLLAAVSHDAWDRAGEQEGVGHVTLADIPRSMADHDRSHAREIAELLETLAPGAPVLAAIRAVAERPVRRQAA